MLSFEQIDNKKPICTIKNSDNKSIQNIYLYDKIDKNEIGFEDLNLSEGFQFQIIPDMNKEREILYIAGSSGSGKSYFCKEYLKEYIKLHPKKLKYQRKCQN
jgi:ABC-type dipeptide/oligopeptide/nickel transport system ATPase component